MATLKQLWAITGRLVGILLVGVIGYAWLIAVIALCEIATSF